LASPTLEQPLGTSVNNMFLEDSRAGVEATAERRRHMGVFRWPSYQ
jgi:hypothetical protein